MERPKRKRAYPPVKIENQHIVLRLDRLLWRFSTLLKVRLLDFKFSSPHCSIIPDDPIFLRENEVEIYSLCEELEINCKRIETIEGSKSPEILSSEVNSLVTSIQTIADSLDVFLGNSGYRNLYPTELSTIFLLDKVIDELNEDIVRVFRIAGIKQKTVEKLNLYKLKTKNESEFAKLISELKGLAPESVKELDYLPKFEL